jgi:AAA domain
MAKRINKMSLLSTVEKPQDRPPIITICGDAGTGKTRLAATFPNAIFIRGEDGLQSVPKADRPDAFPILKTADQLFEQMMALIKEPHEYKTVVIDSVSAIEQLFIADVLARDGKAKSLNQALGGYGNGRGAVATMHQRLRKAAQALSDRRGVTVVFIAHADIEKMSLPDSDDYSRYSLRLMPTSLPYYVDDVDMVAFIRLVTAVRGDDGERKRAVSTGDREIICHAAASCVSKNRYGITEPIDVPEGENPLLALIPGMGAKPKAVKAKKEPEPEPEPATEETTDDDHV